MCRALIRLVIHVATFRNHDRHIARQFAIHVSARGVDEFSTEASAVG
jgi:hypothetical protein